MAIRVIRVVISIIAERTKPIVKSALEMLFDLAHVLVRLVKMVSSV